MDEVWWARRETVLSTGVPISFSICLLDSPCILAMSQGINLCQIPRVRCDQVVSWYCYPLPIAHAYWKRISQLKKHIYVP